MSNELFKQVNRIRGKFATSTHTRLYKSMESNLKSQIERLNRQTTGFWKLIRLRDEEILSLKQKLKRYE